MGERFGLSVYLSNSHRMREREDVYLRGFEEQKGTVQTLPMIAGR